MKSTQLKENLQDGALSKETINTYTLLAILQVLERIEKSIDNSNENR